MEIKHKILQICLNIAPIVLMILLIPIVKNDYILLLTYILIIIISFIIKYNSKEYLFFIFGLIGMTISEYLFISTGVEVFIRNSFLGLMPIWLPVLWAYAFIVMKRCITIIDK